MEGLAEILISPVNMIFDCAGMFLSSLSDGGVLSAAGSGVTIAFASGALSTAGVTDGVRAAVRRWHGGIDDRFGNIDNLVNLVTEHRTKWAIPPDLLSQLTGNRNGLQTLINKCRTTSGSSADRAQRNSLLKSTTDLCLLRVKTWAYGAFSAGVMTADDIHRIGFLLPGEYGGHHERTDATDITPEVKVKIVNEDFIHVVIDRSAGENAAQVKHGWPPGVRYALIVITADDGKTEICRRLITRLHNDIQMPAGSHGRQFIIKASFLKHIDDEPRFGNESTFSMPRTTEDLVAGLDRRHHVEAEMQRQEIERLRREVERLQAALDAKKN
jgi:hypothetical protein